MANRSLVVIWWSIKNVSFLKKSESTYLDQVKWGCAVADNKLISSPINLLVLWAIATHFNFHSSHLSNSSYCTKKSSRHGTTNFAPWKKINLDAAPTYYYYYGGSPNIDLPGSFHVPHQDPTLDKVQWWSPLGKVLVSTTKVIFEKQNLLFTFGE